MAAVSPALSPVAHRRPPSSGPLAPLPVAGLPRTSVALLVAVAVAFLCIGVALALFLVKFVLR
jgi:hypothetical protein